MRKKITKIASFLLTGAMLLSLSACDFGVLMDKVINGDWEGAINEMLKGEDEPLDPIYTENLNIHFLELGNKYTGDCTLIKTGDTEVLIDAGSRKSSAGTLVPYIQQYCTDGKLEYVIATHAHQDHIAGFVGTAEFDGVLESFEIGTIIDFPKTDSDADIVYDYYDLRDQLVENGTKHYTALECYNNENGAQRSYELDEDITLNILYQKYYEEEASDENDYSVCVLLSQGINHYLFTGDLEAHGEESLVENNDLPKCKLFKAGHHGSPSSSSNALLEVIEPEIVCVCCCAGSPEYTTNNENQFPSQAFINRVGMYTDQIFVTSLAIVEEVIKDGETKYDYTNTSMNGNIVISSDGGEVHVQCSNNNTILKETAWFQENRTWPAGGK
ncbi:MAG: MBL fold metallo-hydrolase [Clostridia bacterium]|nr:MBL fold metallo-hydrolase [Clostridia bacterium]